MTPEQQRALAIARARMKAGQTGAAPQQPQGSMGWGDVATQAVSNIPSSAAQFGSDIATPFLHPIDTAKSLGNLGLGAAQKLIPGEQGSEKYADAVGEFLSSRYGGMDEFKNTLANDPVGVLSDFATVLSGGGGLAAKLPGMAGKVGKMAQTAGRMSDPLVMAGKGASATAKGIGNVAANTIGIMSGTGTAPIKELYSAGKTGGDALRSAKSNVRGGAAEMDALLQDAKLGLREMRQQRSEAYKSGMVDVSKDAPVIDFKHVNDAFKKAINENTFNGVSKSEGAAKALTEINAEIKNWAVRDPSQFHTPEGLDVLKQRIGDLMDWKNKGKKENRAFQSMYNDIKGLIENQAPGYANTMQDYGEATSQINEIEKALSLGDNAMADTAMRKLSSVMRNNVNTNYGARGDAAKVLQTASGKPLLPGIAGQAANAWTPRGLASINARAALTGISGMALSPWALATLPLQSPRLMGEAAMAAGQGGRLAADLARKTKINPRIAGNLSFQAGRLANELKRNR